MNPYRWLIAAAACAILPSVQADVNKPGPAGEPQHATDNSLERLEHAAGRHSNDAALQYNLGTRRYLQGDYDKAASALSQALGFARGRLQSRAAYNLGDALYRQGQAKAATAPDQAGRLYSQALEHYRAAIRQDPHDEDARFNYELVERRLKELQAKQESQKQSQQQAGEGGERRQAEQAGSQAQQSQPSGQAPAHEQQTQQNPAQASTAAQSQSQGSAESSQPQTDEQEGQEVAAAHDQQPAPHDHASGAAKAGQGRELSQQEMLWILDSVKREEQAASMNRQRQPAQEPSVDQDW